MGAVAGESKERAGGIQTGICLEEQVGFCLKVSIAGTKLHDQKKKKKRKKKELTLPHYCSSPKEVRAGTQAGQEPGEGGDAEAIEKGCLLACFPWLSHRTQDHQLRDSTTHNGLGSPH